MTINTLERKEALKRFYQVTSPHNKKDSRKEPSENENRRCKVRRRLELIKEARELGCSVEDLL